MNLERLKKQLIEDEGCKDHIYLDSKGIATFGIGHKLTKQDPEYYAYKNLPKGGILKITDDRISQAFKEDVDCACKASVNKIEDFYELPDQIQEVVVNMIFNMGPSGFGLFKEFIKALAVKNYAVAVKEMKDSDWYRKDVPNRAARLINIVNSYA